VAEIEKSNKKTEELENPTKKLQQCRAQQKHEKQLTQEDCKGKMWAVVAKYPPAINCALNIYKRI